MQVDSGGPELGERGRDVGRGGTKVDRSLGAGAPDMDGRELDMGRAMDLMRTEGFPFFR